MLESIVVLGMLLYALTNFAKLIRNRDWNGALTQGVVWVASIGGVVVFAQTSWAGNVDVLGIALSDLNLAELLVVGLIPAAFGIVLYDGKKALDGSDTARSLPLFSKLPTGGKKALAAQTPVDLDSLAAFEVADEVPAAFEEDAHDAEDQTNFT